MSFIYNQLFVTPTVPTHDFTSQTVIVTGSNVGLGLEAARHFTRLNASKVILAVRNTAAGEEAKASIEKTTKRTSVVEVWQLDLCSYSSVTAFAEKAKALERLDVLLENAGIATGTFRLAEGHESTLTINVISTFLLACLLMPKLQETAEKFSTKAHLTIVSSEVHGWTSFKERNEESIFEVLDDEKRTDMSDRYPLSKLLEILAVRHIAPLVSKAYPGVVLNTTTPGLCHSSLARDAGWGLYLLKLVLARTTEVGSRTLVSPTTAGEESHGKYFINGVVGEGELSALAKSEEGAQAGAKVWKELKVMLEEVSKGVTKDLD